MSTRKTKNETDEIETGGAEANAVQEETEEQRMRRQKEQDDAFFAKLPDPCVYCGPSVRGVARQFTVYNGGIPEELKKFVQEHRAAKGLLVSVERFAQMRQRLETPGTGEAILFQKVRSEL